MQDYPAGEFLLPLFPLPSLVFFPGTRVPLHVFEPRYKQLISDALAAEQRFGIVLLKPGFEPNYYGAPPLFEHGTMAQIEQSVQLDEGKYNILVRGVVRFRIVEMTAEQPYRIARVVASPEREPDPMEAWAQRQWLTELSQRFLEFMPGDGEVPELASATLESLSNALVMSLNLDATEKQKLLELDQIITRANRVGDLLAERLQTLQFLAPFRTGGDPQMN
jgi:Lon protease-like protein